MMIFQTCIYVVPLVCFASFPAAASGAAVDKRATVQAQAVRNDAANKTEADVAPAGDGEDNSHAIFVWSIVCGCIFGNLGIVGLVLWLVFRYEKKRSSPVNGKQNAKGSSNLLRQKKVNGPSILN